VTVVVDDTDSIEVTAIVAREDGALVSATLDAKGTFVAVHDSELGVVPTTPFESGSATQLVFGTGSNASNGLSGSSAATQQVVVYDAVASPRVYGRCVLGADGIYDVFESRGRPAPAWCSRARSTRARCSRFPTGSSPSGRPRW
jgi:hypothetical protein